MAIDWTTLIVPVYFLYGLAFYSMGLALMVESGRASELGFARSMRLLAGFALLHGAHEWLEFLERILYWTNDLTLPAWVVWFRVALLASSFLALVAFGEHLRSLEDQDKPRINLVVLAVIWYAASCIIIQAANQLDEASWAAVCDVLARYVLGIPASILAAFVLFRQRKNILNEKMQRYAIYFSFAAVSMLIYGVIGQIFVRQTLIFPATIINEDLFMYLCGFPVQVLRALMALVLSIAMISALRVLEIEAEQRLEGIEKARRDIEYRSREELSRLNASLQASEAEARQLLMELKRRDSIRTEFIQQVTAAQESERKRIARELHDGTGQMLTGLALGLRGLSRQVYDNPDMVVKRLSDLEVMATTTIGELRTLIQDLRPPQLDDMGLIPAIRSMLDRLKHVDAPEYELKITGDPYPLPSDVETILFRIIQEGLNNSAKHAHANHVKVCLDYGDEVGICVCDDGIGCDPEMVLAPTPTRSSWGLMGIEERANLINAVWSFESELKQGTTLRVRVPRPVAAQSEAQPHDD
ncbi:MAG: sensor histidine kinase [Anaerolineae bacterium]|nr:sensor histidine kinase [Anaerolineae bacterium]